MTSNSPSKSITRTLAILKNSLVKDEESCQYIVSRIKSCGFEVIDTRVMDGEEALDFDLGPDPVRVYVLQKADAIQAWKDLMGPQTLSDQHSTCLRAKFGVDKFSGPPTSELAENCIESMFPHLIKTHDPLLDSPSNTSSNFADRERRVFTVDEEDEDDDSMLKDKSTTLTATTTTATTRDDDNDDDDSFQHQNVSQSESIDFVSQGIKSLSINDTRKRSLPDLPQDQLQEQSEEQLLSLQHQHENEQELLLQEQQEQQYMQEELEQSSLSSSTSSRKKKVINTNVASTSPLLSPTTTTTTNDDGRTPSPFKARPLPSTHLSPEIQPRMSRAAALRLGLDVPTKPSRPASTTPSEPDMVTPGVNRRPLSEAERPKSLAAPVVMPRQTRASAFRTTKSPSDPAAPKPISAPSVRRESKGTSERGKGFEGVAGFKRRESLIVAATREPATPPRLNRASMLRQAKDQQSQQPPPSPSTAAASIASANAAADAATTAANEQATATAAASRRRSVDISSLRRPPSIAPRQTRASELRQQGGGTTPTSTKSSSSDKDSNSRARPRASSAVSSASKDSSSTNNENIFQGVPGHKRSETIQVASLRKPPTIAPRGNRSAELRKGSDRPASSTGFAPSNTSKRSSMYLSKD